MTAVLTMAETKSASDHSPSRSLAQLPPFQWHLLLCADQTKPKCCTIAAGLEAWAYLKTRIKELGLDSGHIQVHRTKANCLRGCDYCIPGPVMVVYPGGFWYRTVTPEAIERILHEHVLGGVPVQDLLVGQVSLQEPDNSELLDDPEILDALKTPDKLCLDPPTEPISLTGSE